LHIQTTSVTVRNRAHLKAKEATAALQEELRSVEASLTNGGLNADHDGSRQRKVVALTKKVKHAKEAEKKGDFWFAPLWVLQDTRLVWLTTLFALAVIASTVDSIYFCFHLLDLLTKSRELRKLVEAITGNAKSLIYAFTLLVIVLHIFAVMGYALHGIQPQFVGHTCDSLRDQHVDRRIHARWSWRHDGPNRKGHHRRWRARELV
jgi:hypothetical protein